MTITIKREGAFSFDPKIGADFREWTFNFHGETTTKEEVLRCAALAALDHIRVKLESMEPAALFNAFGVECGLDRMRVYHSLSDSPPLPAETQ